MSLIAAIAAAVLGWVTLAATAVWYRVVVLPELYIDDSPVPFIAVVILGAAAFLLVLIGAIRRTRERLDGLPAMIIGAFVLLAIIFSTLPTTGVLLIPGFLVSTLAASLPPTRPWSKG